MECIEEIFNVPRLANIFNTLVEKQKVTPVIEEIVLQSEIEFESLSKEIS